MATEKTVYVRSGTSALSILGIIFVLCKIFAIGPIAAWSWWLVLLPFYIGILFVLCFFGFFVLMAIGAGAVYALGVGWEFFTELSRAKKREKQRQERLSRRD
jgi:membrane protein implicated in regulation of membrane protease activity